MGALELHLIDILVETHFESDNVKLGRNGRLCLLYTCRYLNMSGCYRISSEAVKEVCASLSALQTLDIRNCRFSLKEDMMTLLSARGIKLLT